MSSKTMDGNTNIDRFKARGSKIVYNQNLGHSLVNEESGEDEQPITTQKSQPLGGFSNNELQTYKMPSDTQNNSSK